jgi:SAM-dependent methyltransferase
MKLTSFLYSTDPNQIWLKVLILLTLVVIVVFLYKKAWTWTKKEGFEQNKRYLLKRNDDRIDDFFVEVYDVIHPPETCVEAQINTIVQMTQPSMSSSVFLDIGSATGAAAESLLDKGYKAYGVDSSQAMVNYSKRVHPSLSVTCGDVKDAMLFEKGTFSHITCLHFAVYSFQDKVAFFKNCYHWLKSGGYLIVHMVDKPRFNATIPAAFNPFNWGMIQANFSEPWKKRPTEERSLKTVADFGAFTYDAEYDVQPNRTEVVFREKFTDKDTTHIRENEQTLYMEEMGEIVNDALFCNFIVQGKLSLADVNGGDPHQYLYIFER